MSKKASEIVIHVVASMPGQPEKELIKGVTCQLNQKGELIIASVCQKLKDLGYPVANSLISYFSVEDDIFTFLRKEPLLQSDTVD